jgi:hypothetical protein
MYDDLAFAFVSTGAKKGPMPISERAMIPNNKACMYRMTSSPMQ